MFKAKRSSIRLPDARAMSVALAAVRAVQARHDARLMLLVFLDRIGLIGSQLKVLGMETDESLKELFDAALEQAKKPPRFAPKPFNPDTKQEGKPS